MAFLFAGVGLAAVAALRDRPALQWPGYILIACAVMVKGPLALVLSGLAMALSMAMSADLRRRLLGLHWIARSWHCRRDLLAVVHLHVPAVPGRLRGRVSARREHPAVRDRSLYGAAWVLVLFPDSRHRHAAVDRDPDRPSRRRCAVRREGQGRDGVEVLLWAWTIAVVGFFTFSRFKLDHYVFAAAPTLCLLCARAWVDLREHPDSPEHRGARIGLWLVGPSLVLMGAAAGYFLMAQLDLPTATYVVPVAVIVAGLLMLARSMRVTGGRRGFHGWRSPH